MSENTIELTDKNFDSQIKKGNWVIDFWAEWCGPCRMMAPEFEAAAKEMKGKINFGKVDVDSNQEIAGRFQIMSIPTMILFKDGEQVQRVSGAMPKKSILELTKQGF